MPASAGCTIAIPVAPPETPYPVPAAPEGLAEPRPRPPPKPLSSAPLPENHSGTATSAPVLSGAPPHRNHRRSLTAATNGLLANHRRFGPLLTRITDNWSRIVSDITYDVVDRVKTYTDKGETYSYTYSYGGGSTTSKSDSQGNSYIYPFGANGLVYGGTSPTGDISADLPPMCGPLNMTLLRPSGLG